MRIEHQGPLAIGDAVMIVGTGHDGELGTIIRLDQDRQYVVALEDGSEEIFKAEELSLRH